MRLAKQSEYSSQNTWVVPIAEARWTLADHCEGQGRPLWEALRRGIPGNFTEHAPRGSDEVRQPELESPAPHFLLGDLGKVT